MALDTVGDYVTQARTLLLDNLEPYRYPNSDIVVALNLGVLEATRLRPDLFYKTLRTTLNPSYTASVLTTPVVFDPRYRTALLNYIVSYAQLRDDEPTQDQRAVGFRNMFVAQFTTPQA